MKEKNKQIFISEKTYEELKKAYQTFLETKDKIPPVIFEQMGGSFEDYVEHILLEYCETYNNFSRIEEKMKDAAGSGFNLNDLQDALAKMGELFGKKDESKTKTSDEKTNTEPNDNSKVKN